MRPMPVIDGILAVDEHGNGDKSDDDEAVAGEEIAERHAEDALVVERIGIERQHDHRQHEGEQAGQHLHLGVPPIGLALVTLHHVEAHFASCSRHRPAAAELLLGRSCTLAAIRGSTAATHAQTRNEHRRSHGAIGAHRPRD